MRLLLVLLVAQCWAWAGQSIQLTTAYVSGSLPAATGSWMVETYIHDWDSTSTAKVMTSNAIGLDVTLIYSSGDIHVQAYNARTTGGIVFDYIVTVPDKAIYLRYRHDTPNLTDSMELWDRYGSRISAQTHTYTSEAAGSTGIQVGYAGGAARSVAFVRVHPALVPFGSRMPVTAETAAATLHWKFDGSLADSAGSYPGTMSSGSPTYVSTPYQSLVKPIIRTTDAPAWGTWRPMRVGSTGSLDGSQSFSQADAGSSVTCVWSQLSGPTTLSWSSTSSCSPTVTGHVFGDYQLQLVATDPASQTGTGTEHIGAVPMDANGVVTHTDPKIGQLFGPMIALGYNPWGYADERALTATRLRWQAYQDQGLVNPVWETPQTGTVTYTFNGATAAGSGATTLVTGVNSTDTSIVVADASKLDLSVLPTRILIGSFPYEEVRICSTTGTSGQQTLTVCYDGRGRGGDSGLAVAQSWSIGTAVNQQKASGTSTQFLTTICPGGAGPAGAVTYSTGTVALSAGSTAVVGSGTTWNSTNGVIATYALRVAATHSGTSFVFWSPIASVTDTTHLTLGRAFPADADPGSYSYSVVAFDVRHVVLYYTRPGDSSSAKTYFQTSGCESNTALYMFGGHDVASLDGTVQSGKSYSYMDGFGYSSPFGPNFYGEGIAHRALYYRSGLQMALDAARAMDNHYVASPQVAGGDVGGLPLTLGGGVVGGFFSAILDPGYVLWSDLRGLAARGAAVAAVACDDVDTRDSGYLGAWLTLAANYDPDNTQRAAWKVALGHVLGRDNACKRSDASFANGFIWNNSSPSLTLTNGSSTVTGTGLSSSLCLGLTSGTLSVTNGSATITGTGLINGAKIAITGTRSGAAYTGWFEFTQSGGTSGSLSGLWPGDTGTATYMIDADPGLGGEHNIVIADSSTDPQMHKNWSCIWNNSTQLTLNRPWDGANTSSAHLFRYTVTGYGQGPFLLGIKMTGMRWGAQSDDGTLSSGFSALRPASAAWIKNTGYDPYTQGLYYGRIYQACEPPATPAGIFNSRQPGCNNGLNPASIRQARVLAAEATSALLAYYQANPTQEAIDWGDQVYGSIWGYAPYTTGGVYSDSNYVRDENSDVSLGAYKWTGFFFGMGMAHQWPAIRLSGVAPPSAQSQFSGAMAVHGAFRFGTFSAISWATMTSGQWAALTSWQWAAMVP